MVAYRYLPLLRSKAGEGTALQNLTAPQKERMLPLIHVSEQPPAGFAQRAIQAWSGLPMALDGMFNFDTTGSVDDFSRIFASLGNGGVRIIPAVEYGAPPQYASSVSAMLGRYAPGLVLKATVGQLPMLHSWVSAQQLSEANIDLVVDAGHIAAYGDAAQFAAFVAHSLTNAISQPPAWRSVTLASAAAPRDYSAFAAGRSTAPRLDWRLWQHVSGQVPFQLEYG